VNVLLGDEVTVQREMGEQLTFVSGRVNGIVLDDRGDLRYFYIKGIDGAFWISDGWKFQEEYDEGEDDA
jgi:hypothetical protein